MVPRTGRPRLPVGKRRKLHAFKLSPEASERLSVAAKIYGLTKTQLVERAIMRLKVG